MVSLLLLVFLAALFYFQVPLVLSTVATSAIFLVLYFAGFTGGWFVFSLLIFIAIAVPINIPALRQRFFSAIGLQFFRRVMPQISETEREALDAGTVWWEAELFSGVPDWNKLHSYKTPKLTEAEKEFLDGKVEQLCKMLDDWEITGKLHDLPEDVWNYIKKEKFFGMIIPTQYGGLGFSAYAHSQVVMKIASRSVTAAVTIMVPNSLGPAELVMHYGSDEDKEKFLPSLADGSEIPCFALTSPEAGSDAASMPDYGVVEEGEFEGEKVVGIRLNFDKRYITLAPIATLMGLAFKLYDPNKLLGDKEALGITVALLPMNLKGISRGERHEPLGIPFMNGPLRGKDVFIPASWIVGGTEYAGKGWKMLMERLAVGRSISLPAISTSAIKLAARDTGAYARVRQQFGLPIGKFEGVDELLARIAGNAYLVDAGRVMTVGATDSGERPSLVSAIAKYNLTERMRQSVTDAMDIQGGGAISLGPRNFMGRVYQAIPISITVEGANVLTRTLITFGQGIIRAHPWVLKEIEAAFNKDEAVALREFDKAFFGHIGFTVSTLIHVVTSSLTSAYLLPAPSGSVLKRYYQQIGRLSAGFSLLADVSMLILGGTLKRKEKLSGRMADALSELYLSTAVLKRFKDEGEHGMDIPLAKYALEDSLHNAEKALSGVLDNFPIKPVAVVLRLLLFPAGKSFHGPSDKLGSEVAAILLEPSESRDRLVHGISTFMEKDSPAGRLAYALDKVIEADDAEKKLRRGMRDGTVTGYTFDENISSAVSGGLLSMDEANLVSKARAARLDVIAVDEFPEDYWRQ